jgi:hypothetical protein
MPLYKSRNNVDRILKWVLTYRKQNVVIYQKALKNLKEIINKNINYTASIPATNELKYNFLKFILGQSYHSKYTEPIYTDTAYSLLQLPPVNELFPFLPRQAKKCDKYVVIFCYLFVIHLPQNYLKKT